MKAGRKSPEVRTSEIRLGDNQTWCLKGIDFSAPMNKYWSLRAESKPLERSAGIPYGVLGRESADICREREPGGESEEPVVMTGLD